LLLLQFSYDLFGESMSAAYKLAKLTPENSVLLSSAAYHALNVKRYMEIVKYPTKI
jgi:class 3 adenylate cyclase